MKEHEYRDPNVLNQKIGSAGRFQERLALSDEKIKARGAARIASLHPSLPRNEFIDTVLGIGLTVDAQREKLKKTAEFLDGEKNKWQETLSSVAQITHNQAIETSQTAEHNTQEEAEIAAEELPYNLSRDEALVLTHVMIARNNTQVVLKNGQSAIIQVPDEEIEYVKEALSLYPSYLETPNLRSKLEYHVARNQALLKIAELLRQNKLQDVINNPQEEKIIEAVQIALSADTFQHPQAFAIIKALSLEDADFVWCKERERKNGNGVSKSRDEIRFSEEEILDFQRIANKYLDEMNKGLVFDGATYHGYRRVFGRLDTEKFRQALRKKIISVEGYNLKHRLHTYSRRDAAALLFAIDTLPIRSDPSRLTENDIRKIEEFKKVFDEESAKRKEQDLRN